MVTVKKGGIAKSALKVTDKGETHNFDQISKSFEHVQYTYSVDMPNKDLCVSGLIAACKPHINVRQNWLKWSISPKVNSLRGLL